MAFLKFSVPSKMIERGFAPSSMVELFNVVAERHELFAGAYFAIERYFGDFRMVGEPGADSLRPVRRLNNTGGNTCFNIKSQPGLVGAHCGFLSDGLKISRSATASAGADFNKRFCRRVVPSRRLPGAHITQAASRRCKLEVHRQDPVGYPPIDGASSKKLKSIGTVAMFHRLRFLQRVAWYPNLNGGQAHRYVHAVKCRRL